MFFSRKDPLIPFTVAAASVLAALSGLAQDDATLSIEELLQQRRFEDALPLIKEREQEWDAAVRRSDAEENRMGWTRALLLLGMVQDRLNRYEPALKNLRLARDLAVEADAEPDFLGDVLDSLGRAEHHAAEYEAAEESLRQAISEREQLGPDSREPWLSASRDHLALLFLETGRYQEAARIFHETIQAAGENREVLAQRHGYLGKYYHTMRSYAKACDHLERALEYAQEAWSDDHPNIISLTGQLGVAYHRLGSRPGRAEMLLQRAVDLSSAQPPTHQTGLALAIYLANLAELSLRAGQFEEAREAYRASLDMLTPRVGDSSPVLAPFYNNIGYAHQALGEFDDAQAAFYEAALRYENSVGTKHQRYLESRLNLVETLFRAEGLTEKTEREVRSVTASGLLVFDDVLAFGTQRQRLNWRERVDLVSPPCSLGSDPGFIANTLIQTKARLLDSLLAEEAAAGGVLEQLRAKQHQLDDLLFRFETPDELDALRDEIAGLESELRDELASGVETSGSSPDWTAVEAGLPREGAFVDYVRYEDYRSAVDAPYRYGAVLYLPESEPQWIPLGTQNELDTWLRVLKERLDYRTYRLGSGRSADPPAFRLSSALRGLYDAFWAPVAARLPEATQSIAISPDGALNFVSFAVLLDENSTFLANKFQQIVYTASARDLLVKERQPPLSQGQWTVVAVPEFEEPPGLVVERVPDALAQVVLETVEAFAEVPGAREELERIRAVTPSSTRGSDILNATERQLRNAPASPTVLHLSTHAFFLPEARAEGVRGVQDFDQQPDRLYRSGLVLTEAKRALTERLNGADVAIDRDGVLFPDEVRDLPLQGTRLVTLSSCESGLGESVSGEGVLGLRRGFNLAGASNLLISLWPVADTSTPEFMEEMYRLALDTDQLGQSLWEAQRRRLAGVDTTDDEDLEEAVLRYGCFALCQRGPLQAAVAMPDYEKPFRHWGAVALVLTGIFVYLITRPVRPGSK